MTPDLREAGLRTRKFERPRPPRWTMRRKLILAFLVVTVLPLLLSLGLLSLLVEREFRQELERRSDDARHGVQLRLDSLEQDLDRALERIAADPIVGYLSQDLKWERFYGDQQREREVVRATSRLMTAPQLDVLKIVDVQRDGYVIAMGHRRGVEPPDREALAVARAPGRRAVWRRESLPREGAEPLAVWTLQAVRPVDERLVLVGGRVLDGTLLAALGAGLAGDPGLTLRDPEGELVASTFPEGRGGPPADETSEVTTVARLVGDGSARTMTLGLHLSLAELDRTLADLVRFAAVLGGLGLFVSLILGTLLARTITRPLRALVAGAEALARGRLDYRIPVTSRDEVGALVGRFNRMAAELDESQGRLVQAERVAAWKDIARQIAHEVKNPLFPIQTSVETLQRAWTRKHPKFEEIFAETTRTVLEEVERLKHIVGEFSRFARLPAPRLVPTDLNGLLHDTAVLFGGETAGGVVIEEALAPDLPPVPLDPTLLGQVANNLVKNAVEAVAGRETPRVLLRSGRVEGAVWFCVEDSGPGVPPARREEIFRPYVTDKEGGTGLGLAIAHRVVTEHGGGLRVEDGSLGGARFVVALPLGRPGVGDDGTQG
jgi:signal transduction histidine kinase